MLSDFHILEIVRYNGLYAVDIISIIYTSLQIPNQSVRAYMQEYRNAFVSVCLLAYLTSLIFHISKKSSWTSEHSDPFKLVLSWQLSSVGIMSSCSLLVYPLSVSLVSTLPLLLSIS